ncbi:MAG: cell wall metabolism sensor histidine kinase WalK [Clostridiales bacterium]|nr:cell wall metabolism sensor histidine kinase WalK [Clostridiales bacterium]
MFKTIFAKQITVLISVILIAFVVETSVFFVFLSDVVSNEKETELEYVADQLDNFMRYYMANSENRMAATQLRLAIERTAELYDSIIMVIYSDGRLIYPASSGALRDILTNVLAQFTYDGGILRIRDERQYARAFALAEGEVSKDTGDFHGLFRESGYPWLNLQKKFMIESADGLDFVYAISMHAPMPFVQQARLTMIGLVFQAAIAATLISVVIGFFFSRRLTRPIRLINEAARVIANGNFSERIRIESKDEIGQLAGTFNHMVGELENLEVTRREFIANVSHELRTPMTSIKGFVEGILDGTIPRENQDRYLRIVKDETERLNRLVNNLLDIARLESGEYRLNMTRFDVVEVTRRCVISFARLIEEKNLKIEASFDRDEMYAEGDADSIERVIYNLFHNAIKFSNPDGGIRIAVREDRELLSVSVSDDGVGIAEDELTKIWERFYKSDKSRGQDKVGTGLGLSIIRNIIHEHKQKINVFSKLGEGTTFEFTLKKAADEPEKEWIYGGGVYFFTAEKVPKTRRGFRIPPDP